MKSETFSIKVNHKIKPFHKIIEVDSDKSLSIRSFLIGSICQNISTVTTFSEIGLSPAIKYDVFNVFERQTIKGVSSSFRSMIPAYVKHNRQPAAGAILYLISPARRKH